MTQTNTIRNNEIPYSESSDDLNEMDGTGWVSMEDEGGSDEVGGDGYSSSGDLGSYLRDLQGMLNDSKLSSTQRREVLRQILSLSGRVSRAERMNPRAAETELSKIDAEIAKLEAKIAGTPQKTEGTSETGDDMGSTDGEAVDYKKLKKDLEDAIEDIESRSNLSDDEKIELKTPLEKHLTDLGIAEKGKKEIDAEQIQEDIATAKEATEAQDAYAPGVKVLAQNFGLEPEMIKAKAEQKGMDLANLPSPPTKAVLEFLAELSPELKTQFDKVEDAINSRITSIQQYHTAAANIADANDDSTTDSDSHDVSAWQALYDAKHFQDKESKNVMEAMKAVVATLTPLLKALYPGQEIKAVEPSGAAGWQKIEAEYKVADKIQIGGVTLDLFNNIEGTLDPKTTADNDLDVHIPTINYDAEGAGEWSPPKLNTYGETQAFNQYDKDAGGVGFIPW